MNITSDEILQKIYEGFNKIYKAFNNFVDSGFLWEECIKTVKDTDLMNKIIFCNDILNVPPVKVFVLVNEKIPSNLTDYEKKAIGAFWGYVFKFVFGYRNQRSVPINVKGIKTATTFFDVKEQIVVK
ncbi:hypothetical protein Q3V94_06925 [Caloramator sp. CAR-1]|uniref:hypothetical protein n=1 Tax=Caloramator sp. CAR-1 TaxID=3062777 RepID=UPI0026E15BD4|nr:hypothetical protein [Caloramator sp. CAR-1]MDO6354811.1 hypothetical protein [Caloramator sp. CAR-1]